MRHSICLILLTINYFILSSLFVSCKSNGTSDSSSVQEVEETIVEVDSAAMSRFEGIWVNAETQNVVLRVIGDSIFYPDTVNLPVRFSIVNDSLVLYGEEDTKYLIKKQGDYVFHFVSSMGEEVNLHKSENPEDSLAFSLVRIKPIIYNNVTKRDTVVNYSGTRYHCYVFVNPSRNRVYKNSLNDEGIDVSTYYYDNVIHLSVYKGNQALLSRDFTKNDFKDLIPAHFLQQSTLSDVNFQHVDGDGFHFDAIICMPDDALCYMVQVLIRMDGKYELTLLDY